MHQVELSQEELRAIIFLIDNKIKTGGIGVGDIRILFPLILKLEPFIEDTTPTDEQIKEALIVPTKAN